MIDKLVAFQVSSRAADDTIIWLFGKMYKTLELI